MSERRTRPSGWIYAVAALIPLLGCLIAMAAAYQWFPGLPGTFESKMNLDNLTQVVVPGSKNIIFAESGAYAVYYEYRSVVDGVVYASSETPPDLACTLTSMATGADVGVVPDYVKTNTYSTKGRERVGVLIRSITIDEPGTYTFSCHYADSGSQPEIALAVGPSFMWEFFGIAARTIFTAAAGMVVLLGSGAVAIVVIVIIAVKRRQSSSLTLIACLMLAALLLSGCGLAQLEDRQDIPTSPSCGDLGLRHCTVLTISQGDRVFFGGNDDYINRDSTFWVDQGGDTRYGAIYFGKSDNVQQGFNEKGLAYDSNGLPQAPVSTHPGRKPVYGSYTSYPIQILRECATVEEVIAWVQEHQWHEVMHDQLHFADATGDAIVISAGPDGRVAFTRKPAGDGFLVSTNFNVANPLNGGYPCWRYSRAEEMLSEIQSQGELTVERVASIMEAVHVEGPSGWTLYSVVADLQQRLVYVYFMFQYDAPIVLSIDEEIARPHPACPLSELLPEETQRRADRAYQWLMARPARCNTAGFTWLGLVAASLAALLLAVRPGRQGLVVWVPVVVVLGPVGLLASLIVARSRRPRALVEAAGDLPPTVVGMVAALLIAALLSETSQNRLLQLLAFYGVPLSFGLLFHQSPLLAWATRSGYTRTVLRRLPAVLVSTNLALAGLWVVSFPLINRHLNYCGFSGLTVLQWWAIAVLGALGGGLLLYVYHVWAVRRGFTAWSALLWDTGEAGDGTMTVSSPPWRRLWLWILLSFVALVAGVIVGFWGTALVAGVR
jgi:hypothetical protein